MNNLPIINKFDRKISVKGAITAGKGFNLFISIEDMNDIIKIIRLLEDLGVSIDGVTETVKHEIKKQEGGFLGTVLALSSASLVQPAISSVVKGISGRGVRRAGKEYIISIMALDLVFFLRNNLYRIKDGAYVINFDDESSIGTQWVPLFIDRITSVYFDSFGIEYIPQELLNKIIYKSITHNVFRIQEWIYYVWILLHRFHRIYGSRKNFVRLY